MTLLAYIIWELRDLKWTAHARWERKNWSGALLLMMVESWFLFWLIRSFTIERADFSRVWDSSRSSPALLHWRLCLGLWIYWRQISSFNFGAFWAIWSSDPPCLIADGSFASMYLWKGKLPRSAVLKSRELWWCKPLSEGFSSFWRFKFNETFWPRPRPVVVPCCSCPVRLYLAWFRCNLVLLCLVYDVFDLWTLILKLWSALKSLGDLLVSLTKPRFRRLLGSPSLWNDSRYGFTLLLLWRVSPFDIPKTISILLRFSFEGSIFE